MKNCPICGETLYELSKINAEQTEQKYYCEKCNILIRREKPLPQLENKLLEDERIIKTKDGMEVKITNKGEVKPVDMKCRTCGYKWVYKGKKTVATCPECKANNKLVGYEALYNRWS